MKKIYFIILPFLISSCYSLKPDSRNLTSKNYNDIQEVSDPVLVKKRNPIGITFQVLTPLVAGAAMYEFVDPVVKYQDGAETKSFQPANAAVGVIGMLAINKVLNYALGHNKVKKLDNSNYNKWIEKTKVANSNNYYFNSEYNNLTIIPKSSESSYVVKNLHDVKQFKLLFPSSETANVDQVVKKATMVLNDEDLVSLINLYPENSESYKAKIKYIETAKEYTEFWNRKNSYPNAKVDEELLASELVTNAKNASDFYKKFSNSQLKKKVVLNALKNEISTLLYQEMIDNYSANFTDLRSSDFEGKSNDQKTNYLKFVLSYNNPNSILDLEVLIDQYVYLANSNSQNLILDFYWYNLDKIYADGNVMLFKLNQLGISNNYTNWKINKNIIDNYIQSKLTTEINRNVSISNVNYTSNTSNVFEEWKKADYTAGIVSNSDGVKYIIYGNIINNSKFDLPLQINASGELIKRVSLEGTGTFSKGLINATKIGVKLMGVDNVDPTKTYQKIGTIENSFSYPSLIKGNIYPWAVMLDYSQYVKQSGMNIEDTFKITDDFIFQRIETNATILTNTDISIEKLKEQSEWQNFAYYGLPNSQLLDEWRRKTVDHSYWKAEEERIAEQRRRWEEERRKQEQFNKNNSLITDSENATHILEVYQEDSKKNQINIYTDSNDDFDCCYSATIYNERYGKPNLLKSFSNIEDKNNSRGDNNIFLNESDFPVSVNIKYTYNKKLVSFSIILTRGAKITVTPK